MKIKESQIRKIVKEEIERMNEMPYGGNLGPVKGSDEPSTSGFSDTYGENRPAAEKFSKSESFKKLAEKHFAKIDNNIFIAPYIGDIDGMYDFASNTVGMDRVRISELENKGIKTLQGFGFSIPKNLNEQFDTVILYSTNSASKGIFATPWMLVHAIFDSESLYRELTPGWASVVQQISSEWDTKKSPIGGDGGFEDGYNWSKLLTMKSARNGEIYSQSDAYAEIMCQEIFTTSGFQIDKSKATTAKLARCAKELELLKKSVIEGSGEFKRNIKGKLIMVAVN